MTTKTIDIDDAKNQLSELLTLANKGTDIILSKDNIPLARLVPVENKSSQPRIAGLHKGAFIISEDFDDPLPDSFWLGKE